MASGSRPEPATNAAERLPQFVAISFDGSGDAELLRYWREVGKRAGARFTFFLSGVYLLGYAHRDAYHPPRHAAGSSDIGFTWADDGDTESQRVAGLVGELSAAHGEGHEIGSHFNGHFCPPLAGNVDTWTAADWAGEIGQFQQLLDAYRNNGITLADSPILPEWIHGARTPCLAGNRTQLRVAMRSARWEYDASGTAAEGIWPTKTDGIWEFPLASIEMQGSGLRVLSMDYNFYFNQSGAHGLPESAAPAIEEQVYESYMAYFNNAYNGDRAPISIGHHFADWNHASYRKALTRFVDDVCQRAEVRCVTYSSLVSWLEQPRKSPSRPAANTYR